MALDLHARAAVHAALGDPGRLAIVDALAWSDCAPGELAVALDMESNLLAHHLGALEAAGVVERVRSTGDGRRRYVRLIPGVLEGARLQPVAPPRRVLFVCTENAARSQMAAAIWNGIRGAGAESAGTRPAAAVHPEAVRVARRHGLDLAGARPRALAALRRRPDLAVTVCDRAHEGGGVEARQVLHWSIPDPAAEGTPDAFERVFRILEERVKRLALGQEPEWRTA